MNLGSFTWDAFATLSTGALAVLAALLVGLRQNRLQSLQAKLAEAAAERSHALGRQALQLQLLEKRISVVDDIRTLWGQWMRDGALNDDDWIRLRSVFHRAQLLYSKDIVNDIGEALDGLAAQKRHQARANQYHSEGREEEAKDHLEKSFTADDKVHSVMMGLLSRIIEASRVAE